MNIERTKAVFRIEYLRLGKRNNIILPAVLLLVMATPVLFIAHHMSANEIASGPEGLRGVFMGMRGAANVGLWWSLWLLYSVVYNINKGVYRSYLLQGWGRGEVFLHVLVEIFYKTLIIILLSLVIYTLASLVYMPDLWSGMRWYDFADIFLQYTLLGLLAALLGWIVPHFWSLLLLFAYTLLEGLVHFAFRQWTEMSFAESDFMPFSIANSSLAGGRELSAGQEALYGIYCLVFMLLLSYRIWKKRM